MTRLKLCGGKQEKNKVTADVSPPAPRLSGALRNEGETLARVVKKIICAGYDDADKSAVVLTAQRKITAVTVTVVTRVEGSDGRIRTAIYIINVR